MTDCVVAGRIDVDATLEAGELKVDGATMHRSAFAVVNVRALWNPAVKRGDSLFIPGLSGRLIMPKRRDETVHALPMLIDGRIDATGAQHPDDIDGLQANIDWIEANITNPTNGGRTLTLTNRQATSTKTGQAHLSLIPGEQLGSLSRAVLEVTLPLGRLV